MDTNEEKQAQVTVVFKLSQEEYARAEPYIGGRKIRGYWAKNAFLEKVSRMEANDKKAREQKMITDAAYINGLIDRGLIHIKQEPK
jgi:hypothetical protein